MANPPPTINVLKYAGAGNVQVFPLPATQILGSQDGSDVGTGAPAPLANLQGANVLGIDLNRNVEFLEDRYCLTADASAGNQSGVYKKNTPGANDWGLVQGGAGVENNLLVDGNSTGLHVLHPLGIPTLARMMFDQNNDLRLFRTEDGLTGAKAAAEWGNAAQVGLPLETASASQPGNGGEAIVYRDSLVWAHANFNGSAGGGHISQFDFVLGVLTRYQVNTILHNNQPGSNLCLHVHNKVLFLFGWDTSGSFFGRLTKLQAGAFVTVYTDATQAADFVGIDEGHSCMFTDPATGDLIIVMSGENNGVGPRAKVIQVQNATTTATPVNDVSATVMGAVEGADKYLQGGGAASDDRRWIANIDTTTVLGTTRVFLTTWDPGGGTETWEWKGVGAEMEAVAALAGITGNDFAFPANAIGGGHRRPRAAGVELGDPANPPVEVVGGTKYFFRGVGSAPVGVVTFLGTDLEDTPATVVPIVPGTLVVESGVPPTTPTISGNTLINFTPDASVSLYSIVLDVDAAGVDIDEGEIGLIIPDFR